TRAPPRDDVITQPCLIAAPCAVTLWHFLRSVSLDKSAQFWAVLCRDWFVSSGLHLSGGIPGRCLGGEASESLTPSLPVLPPIETPNPGTFVPDHTSTSTPLRH